MTTPPSSATAAPGVRVEGVVKHFGETVALGGVDLVVPEGLVCGATGG